MSILSKLTLTATSPREPITPLARKRIKLLNRIIEARKLLEAQYGASNIIGVNPTQN